jgi:hypothetical protein
MDNASTGIFESGATTVEISEGDDLILVAYSLQTRTDSLSVSLTMTEGILLPCG